MKLIKLSIANLANDFNKNKVASSIQQLSDRSMMDLEAWVNQLKISKDDWKEVFDEIEQL